MGYYFNFWNTDYVLVPSPYYRSFDTDFSDMAQAKMYPIDLTSEVSASL